jgi:hypothetical protein
MLGTNAFGWTADEPTCFALLDRFVEAGFNAIDTADVYFKFAPGNRVQHIVQIGFHPRALAGGEDHGGDGSGHGAQMAWKPCHFHSPAFSAA